MVSRASPLAPLLVAALLAGCATQAALPAADEAPLAPPPRPMDWSPGNWWAYHADVQGTTLDVALIVHHADASGVRLGSNLSAGFFGLPFHGELTPEHNPRIGPEVWPLFSFPLEPGKEWGYRLFGHDAKSAVRQGLEPPGAYELAASAFGQTFARYDYDPVVGWFTRLELIEPTNGTVVLSARLTAYGPDWGAAYFVEETLADVHVELPAAPGDLEVALPGGYLQVRGELTVASRLGLVTAEVRDEDGRRLARAEAAPRGGDMARLSMRGVGASSWTLSHAGAGLGYAHLTVTGLAANGPLAAPSASAPELDLLALLQSTRPVVPQEGHAIVTGSPVGS